MLRRENLATPQPCCIFSQVIVRHDGSELSHARCHGTGFDLLGCEDFFRLFAVEALLLDVGELDDWVAVNGSQRILAECQLNMSSGDVGLLLEFLDLEFDAVIFAEPSLDGCWKLDGVVDGEF